MKMLHNILKLIGTSESKYFIVIDDTIHETDMFNYIRYKSQNKIITYLKIENMYDVRIRLYQSSYNSIYYSSYEKCDVIDGDIFIKKSSKETDIYVIDKQLRILNIKDIIC